MRCRFENPLANRVLLVLTYLPLIYLLTLQILCSQSIGIPWVRVSALLPIPLFAAMAISLYPMVSGRDLAVSCIMAILFGMAAVTLVWSVQAAAFHCGLPLERIAGVQGILRFDSGMSEQGNTVLQLGLRKVIGPRGDSAEASGNLMVICESPVDLLAGTPLTAEGELWQAENGTPIFLVESAISVHAPPIFIGSINRFRAAVLERTGRRIEGLPARGEYLGKALLLGLQDGISNLRTSAIHSGAVHVLALSGMHMHLIVTLLGLLIHPIVGKRFEVLVLLPFTLLYVAIVGFKPSLTRALFMLVLRWFLPRLSLQLLLASAYVTQILLCLWTVDSAGTILSYGSLLALITISPRLAALGSMFLPRVCAVALGASLAANIGSAPLSLLLFGSWYPVGICLSVPVTCIAMIVLVLSFCYLVVPWGLLPKAIAFCSDLFVGLVRFGERWSQTHPALGTRDGWISISLLLLTVVGILRYASQSFRKRNRQAYDVGFRIRFTQRDQ